MLVVCTANICRSVMAESFLRRDAAARGLEDLQVSSCGVLFDGEPASAAVQAVLGERDLDVSDHRSRRFSAELLATSDLVVTMERRHARELALTTEGGSPRIHTLGAVAGWLGGVEDLEGSPADRIARFAALRRSSDLLGSGADEIEDPHGRSKRVHRKTADRLEELCAGLLDGLYGAAGTD
jgi:protein-tyrosine phosphatase